MAKPLLILQTGSTHPHISARRGDFTDWFAAGLRVDPARLAILDARNGAALPDAASISGVLITGSHAMVTERQAWSERIAAWLPGLVARGVPILGVCYGHQLLAHALGGEVRDNPRGLDYGAAEIVLNEDGLADPLLGACGPRFQAQVGHVQTVTKLPPGAVHLAHSARDDHQAFRVGERAWGVQFHPEMDAGIIQAYIQTNRERLAADGQDPDALLAGCCDTPESAAILARFGQMAAGG